MKKDIANRHDVILLVDSFYGKVRKDELIGGIFNEVIGNNWDQHLPTMYNFWEDMLFQTQQYDGHPMRVHMQLNQRIPLSAPHFERWKALFTGTVKELFDGPKAELAAQRAVSIATMMQIKMHNAGH